jgi:uncharacterized protein (DUF2141 family)
LDSPKTFLLALLTLLAAFVHLSARAEEKPPVDGKGSITLTITLKGLRNSKGKILVWLYSGEKGFPDKPKEAFRTMAVGLKEGSVPQVQFSGLTTGSYAVSAVHDENDNGEMDTNWIGIPREGLAVSRDAKGSMGPPKFKDAVLEISESQEIKTNFVYL